MSKKKSKKLPLPLIAVLVVLCAGVGLFALEKTGTTDFFKKDQLPVVEGPSPEQQAEDSRINAENKQKLIEQEQAEAEKAPAASENPTPADTSKKIELSGRQESNNTVTVFTKLYGYSSGTCTLTSSNGARTNTQTAQLMYQPEYSSCAGFSVPTDTLQAGNWNITLSVNSNGATTTKTISFEVD